MKIDQLPVETLLRIFSYLPTYREISQVNKVFNSVTYKVNYSHVCLRLDRRFCKRFLTAYTSLQWLDNACLWINWLFFGRYFRSHLTRSRRWMRSIKISERQFFKVKISGIDANESGLHIDGGHPIVPVIEKFASTITRLKLTFLEMDVFTLVKILSMTPNVERLDLLSVDFRTDDPSSNVQHWSDSLNLMKLKSLLIDRCHHKIVRVFTCLPAGVLRELEIRCDLNTLDDIISRQFYIKKLKFSLSNRFDNDEGLAAEIFDKIELDSLTLGLDAIGCPMIAAILSKQEQLKSLILSDETVHYATPIDDRVMDAIADLFGLEELVIDITRVSVEAFEDIECLRTLQNLTLQCERNDFAVVKLEVLAALDNASIKSLTLKWSGKISDEMQNLFNTLAQSAPNLTHLNIIQIDLTTTDRAAVLRHFNFVETLETLVYDEFFLNTLGYFNPMLKKLSLHITYKFFEPNSTCLANLIAAYPNLTTLKITIFSPRTPAKILPILNGFHRLEVLILKVSRINLAQWRRLSVPSVDDVNSLRNRKQNLRFVSLGGLNRCTLTGELMNEMRSVFNVVKVDRCGCLMMAVDRYTMEREREVRCID